VRSIRAEDCGAGEEDWPQRMLEKSLTTRSHLSVQSRDPQTLAAALSDSPAGLAAWIVERRRAWSDCAGDVESRFSRDDLLTTASIYWLTGTIGTSMRFYRESLINRRWTPLHDRSPALEAPAGYAVFPEDVMLVPRRTIERTANVQRWTVMPRGGHFGPAEEPELLVDEIRAFFRDRRS
jgi:pimeloyl-ACP methyl ester carboxylesterase